jgi:hypothetical protein
LDKEDEIMESFTHTSQDPFFPKLHALYKPWTPRFSTGSAAILMPGDPETYVAVGHVVINSNCVHKPLEPVSNTEAAQAGGSVAAAAGGGGGGGDAGTRRILEVEEELEHKLYEVGCKVKHRRGKVHADDNFLGPGHFEKKDYLLYFYSFSAQPPHQLKAVSHSFVLYDAPTHKGTSFALGLAVREGLVYVTYGKDDMQSMLAVWTLEGLKEYLIPVGELEAEEYQFCAVGRNLHRLRLVGS